MPESIQMETQLGEHIAQAIRRASTLAQTEHTSVHFDFNGERLKVQPTDDPEAVYAAWFARKEQKQQEYLASPEYAESQRRLADSTRRHQQQVDDLLGILDATIADGLRPTLLWVADFTDAADHTGVQTPLAQVAHKLSALAVANLHVGRTDLDGPGQEKDAAEFVIGQAVNFLQQGFTPHPVTATFARQAAQRLQSAGGTQ